MTPQRNKLHSKVGTVEFEQLRQMRHLSKNDLDRVNHLVRLTEARFSTLKAGRPVDAVPDRVLTSTLASTRAFAGFLGYTGRLPDGSGLWTIRSNAASPSRLLAQEVKRALDQLVAYQTFEKAQLQIITTELIARYNSDRSLIDKLLPENPKTAESNG